MKGPGNLDRLERKDLPRPLHRSIVGLESIGRTRSAGTDLQRLDITSRPLHKKAVETIAKRFFHLPAGHPRIVCRYGIIKTDDIRMTGIIHDNSTGLPLHVFDPDD